MQHEMQNCLSEAAMACAEFNAAQRVKIDAAVNAGRFAIVGRSAWYCKSTDALAGTAFAFVSDHATREEAEAEAAHLCAQDEGESSLSVVPSVEMEAFRKTGLPDDAYSEWKQARRAEYAFERNLSDRMGEPSF